MKFDIKEILTEKLKEAFKSQGFDESLAVVTNSNKPEVCDFQCNACFALAKKEGKAPFVIAEAVIGNLNGLDEVCEVAFANPGFINFKLKNEAYSSIANAMLNDELVGVAKHEQAKNILVDYGGANVAKELHIGHLRSAIIGEGIKRVHKLLGDSAVGDTHLGDWGLQMGLTMAQLEDDYPEFRDYYFKGKGEKPELSVDMLNAEYPKASKRKNVDEEFKKRAEDYVLKFQKKEEPYISFWKQIYDTSVVVIKKEYDRLNASFEIWKGESDASDFMRKTVQIFKDKGLTRISEGALVVDVAVEGENVKSGKLDENGEEIIYNKMPPLILQKSNGGDLYATSDIATIYMRNLEAHYDELIYLTDSRQIEHFKKVFRGSKLSGISPENQVLTHIPFGAMCGEDGKPFKTRSGDTVKLDEIVSMAQEKAKEKLKSNGTEDKDGLSTKIAISAIKFGDLSNDATKNYLFDIDKFLSFEGKTGPYIQYTATRIKSILRKAGEFKAGITIETEEEKQIILSLLKLNQSYEQAYQGNSLHPICNGVYVLAQSYSTLYNNIRILSEENTARKASLLSLSKLVLKAIEQAFYVLAIDIPEEM